MAVAYQALDYSNTPPWMADVGLVRRPFNFNVNSAGSNVLTLGTGDTIALCTLPASGVGICITRWSLTFGVIDTGTHAAVLELGLVLTSASPTTLDPNAVTAAGAGVFATGITPGSAGGTIASDAAVTAGAAPIIAGTPVLGFLPLSIGLQPNNNGGLYDLVLQVTTPAGTVSAVDCFCRGYIDYQTISQPWSN